MILMGYLQSIERFDIGKYSFPVSTHKRNFTRKFLIPKKLASHIIENEKGFDNSSVDEIKTSHITFFKVSNSTVSVKLYCNNQITKTIKVKSYAA
jgi:hypothetical protein